MSEPCIARSTGVERAAAPGAGHHLGLLGASAGDRGGAAAGASRRAAGADRGHLQPGQPGGRLHRHDAGRLPRLRRRASPTRVGFAREQLILGGDHLGPNPWKHLPAEDGDAARPRHGRGLRRRPASPRSISTPAWAARGEPAALADEIVAARAARLARGRRGRGRAAGGAAARLRHRHRGAGAGRGARGARCIWSRPRPRPRRATCDVHREAFAALGLEAALGAGRSPSSCSPASSSATTNVVVYDPAGAGAERAPGRAAAASSSKRIQPTTSRRRACRRWSSDGFAILKVGPGADLRPARGALRPGPDRQRHRPGLDREVIGGGDGAADAGRPWLLAIALSGHAGRAAFVAPLQLQRSYPLLLAGAGSPRRRSTAFWPLVGPADPRDPDQPVPALPIPARRRRHRTIRTPGFVIEAVRDVLRRYALACRG